MYKIILFLTIFGFGKSFSQELNCAVKVNAQATSNPNLPVFQTLEKALNELVNRTKWSNLTYKQKEKIGCSMFINITAFNVDQFEATIQIQSLRPVYNATYTTPILNYNDKDFTFKYMEFENLTFNANSFDSNLISVVAYYCNIIIGLDADTFAPFGGKDALEAAQEIVSTAQSSGYKGWAQADGNQNRFFFINDLLSTTYSPIREAYFEYHINGIDLMSDNLKSAKNSIANTILTIEKVHDVRPNAFVTRVFFDAKADEIQAIFSGGPSIVISNMVEKLNRISTNNANKWSAIKN